MTTLVWDGTGERFFETGVDRGVLYLEDGTGVPWNGLTGVDEKPINFSTTPLYFEGIKFNEIVNVGDWGATLKAITYPDEFLEYEGTCEIKNGMFVQGQDTKLFGLAFRTKVGNDISQNLGYKIHILTNLTAVPQQKSHVTMAKTAKPIEFEWALTAIPEQIPAFRPTASIVFDSTKSTPEFTQLLEDILYGTDTEPARLPSLEQLINMADSWSP